MIGKHVIATIDGVLLLEPALLGAPVAAGIDDLQSPLTLEHRATRAFLVEFDP